LNDVALNIQNKAPEIYGLAIKFWAYLNIFGQAPRPASVQRFVTAKHPKNHGKFHIPTKGGSNVGSSLSGIDLPKLVRAI
jgi:hypothetical protein